MKQDGTIAMKEGKSPERNIQPKTGNDTESVDYGGEFRWGY